MIRYLYSARYHDSFSDRRQGATVLPMGYILRIGCPLSYVFRVHWLPYWPVMPRIRTSVYFVARLYDLALFKFSVFHCRSHPFHSAAGVKGTA